MKRSGTAYLPLHGGKAPRWLFSRMVELAESISGVFIEERGAEDFIRHICNPFWFQALACVLGFDWHSSGTTTVTCYALKKALSNISAPVRGTGGKGGHSKGAPKEIEQICREFDLPGDKLADTSRLVAKVDNTALQDGYQLYLHSMFLAEGGVWAVLQQGMSDRYGYARRYHWHSDIGENYLNDPHKSILSDLNPKEVLDLSAKDSKDNRNVQLDLVKDGLGHLKRDINLLRTAEIKRKLPKEQATLNSYTEIIEPQSILSQKMTADIPENLPILNMPKLTNWKALSSAYEIQPKGYEQMLLIGGLAPKTIRALSLVAEVIYGEKASWSDPVKFSYAVGGKDGVPFPVNREVYDEIIHLYNDAVTASRAGDKEKLRALERTRRFAPLDM